MPAHDLTDMVDEARELTTRIREQVPGITSVIFDTWGEHEHPRIVWGYEHCDHNCESCPLFQAVGMDPNKEILQSLPFALTLERAAERQLELFPSKEPMLNCKGLMDYLNAYAEWFIHECLTEHELIDEVDWVSKFRMLYMNGIEDPDELTVFERLARQQVIISVYLRYRTTSDLRIRTLAREASRLGLLGRIALVP